MLFSILLFLQDLSIKFCDQTDNIKRGSRGAARAAKSLRWSVWLLLKYLIKKLKTLAIHQFLCLDPLLNITLTVRR